MRTLLTGATGFVGPYLTEALRARGDEVLGVSLHTHWQGRWAHLEGVVPLVACDLGDAASLEEPLKQFRPEWICHLAGYAQPGKSYSEPAAAWAGNLTVTQRLFEAVARSGQKPRILFISTGLVYGDSAPNGPPQDEAHVLAPVSPYAASKAAADMLAYQVTRHPGLDVVRARPFNHIGPGQSPDYAVANFARQLAAIKRGTQAPLLETGDLRPMRDLLDVRDVVAAYVLLLEKGQSGGAYNVASGTSRAMQDVLERMIALSGLKVEVRQRIDPARTHDVLHVRADASKLRRETGWSPQYALDRSLADILEYWEAQV